MTGIDRKIERPGKAHRKVDAAAKIDKKDVLRDTTEDYVDLPASLIPEPGGPKATVMMGHKAKVSEALYWGSSDWDKVPYALDVWGTVTLDCKQDAESITTAQNLAAQLSWEATMQHMRAKMPLLEEAVKLLFPSLFPPGSPTVRKPQS